MSSFGEFVEVVVGPVLAVLLILGAIVGLPLVFQSLPPLHKSATVYGIVLTTQCTQAWLDSSRVVVKFYNGSNAGQQQVYFASFEECLVFSSPTNAEQLWKLTIHTDNGWIVDYKAVTP